MTNRAIIEYDAVKIGEIFTQAKTGMIESVRALVSCGQMLTAKKETLKHGEWLPWLRTNEDILGFGISTANKLMASSESTTNFSSEHALALSKTIWGNKPHLTIGTGMDDWHTPALYIEAARKVLRTIDLDPASSSVSQRTVKAKQYFTAKQDGLTQDWWGNIWLNPPYSQPAIEQFIDKLIAELTVRKVKAAILLTHNSTDTVWFHKAESIAKHICFTKGRIHFINPEKESAQPVQGQAFFYYGNRPTHFCDVFKQVGFIR